MAGYGGVLLKLIDLLARTHTWRRDFAAADYLRVGEPRSE
jgi:hypothetical protein